MSSKFFSHRNIQFIIYKLFDADSLTASDYYQQHNRKLFDRVIKAASTLARNKLYPLLSAMDRLSPALIDNEVKVHPAVAELMAEYGQGGWIGASFSEKQPS